MKIYMVIPAFMTAARVAQITAVVITQDRAAILTTAMALMAVMVLIQVLVLIMVLIHHLIRAVITIRELISSLLQVQAPAIN